jgi:hypothetical protein
MPAHRPARACARLGTGPERAQSVWCLLSEKRGWPGAQQDAAAQRQRQQASGITHARPLPARAGATGGLLKPKPLQLARILHGLPSPLVSSCACNTASSHSSHPPLLLQSPSCLQRRHRKGSWLHMGAHAHTQSYSMSQPARNPTHASAMLCPLLSYSAPCSRSRRQPTVAGCLVPRIPCALLRQAERRAVGAGARGG